MRVIVYVEGSSDRLAMEELLNQDTIDAPLILGASRYDHITAACPQCFKPFVDFLESLL